MEAIGRNVFAPGTRLPSEADLALQLGVSRATLREALRILADRGMIVRRHGLGTFVAETPIHKDLNRNFGITAMIRAAGYSPSTSHQRVWVGEAPPDAARALRLVSGSRAVVLERLRLADKRPVVFSIEVLPETRIDRSDLEELAGEEPSLYSLLERRYRIVIERGEAELVPVKATAELAALLEVPRGSPLMCIRQTDFDRSREPVLYSTEYHVVDWVRFTVERSGPGEFVQRW